MYRIFLEFAHKGTVEHREKLDTELEQLRENRMELEAEIEGKENALNIIDKIIEETEVSY